MRFTCVDCGWDAANADDDPKPPSKRAINHHVDRGHHVERLDDATYRPTSGYSFRGR